MASGFTLYEPLSVNRLEIRVFHLASSQDTNAQIRGFLKTQTLVPSEESSHLPYEALSYTWGSGLAPRNILINDTSVSVGGNLESFLRTRRHATEVVALWIDAICINQNDDDEKSSQIPLMGSIYNHAHRVTVWLGPAADDSDLAMREMRNLGSGSPYDKMPIMKRQILHAFNQLLNRPWWSRVWIIQEVVLGGLGSGLEKLSVTCGSEKVPWSTLVIAATRMMAYKVFKRQHFPGISHILDLESLRENGFLLSKRMARAAQSSGADAKLAVSWTLELVSLYRRFGATDAKDKIYALALMFNSESSLLPAPDYSAPLDSVYRHFAEWCILGMGDLEILKHCGLASARGLPSWVPDWSLDLGCLPLASSKRSLRTEVPWWSDPDDNVGGSMGSYHARPTYEDEGEYEREASIRMKQLEIGSGGLVKLDDVTEVPQSHPFRQALEQLPPEVRDLFSQMTRANTIVGMAMDTGTVPVIQSDNYDDLVENLFKQTRKSASMAMKKSLLNSYQPGSFRSAGATTATVDISGNVLVVKGHGFDTIKDIHEGFVADIETSLESATEFHVAIGQCKAMAEHDEAAIRRYPSLEERMKAFWLTILAGQIPPYAMQTGGDLFSDYMTWLPPVPPSWTAQEPPLTVTTTGLLWYAEGPRAWEEALNSYQTMHSSDGSETYALSSSYKFDGLVPAEWTAEDRQAYTIKFQELANLWKKQRYDLYHTPFETLHVIPDPYWHHRRADDKLAQRKALRWARTDELRPAADEFDQYIASEVTRIRKSRVSMVPYSMLENDIEKFALGRRFFVTEKGYLGLAPKEAQIGDQVTFIFGSDVPFVLRRAPRDGTGLAENKWKIVGEAYVNDLMRGEALEDMSEATSFAIA